MKSFLLKDGHPTIKWGMLEDEIYFEGNVPEGFALAVSPGNSNYIIVDIDNKPEKINGFDNIPENIYKLLMESFNYKTKSGAHVWLKYTGEKQLKNCATKFGLDLRTNKGYVKWYLDKDIRSYIHLVKETSPELNEWLELLFAKSDEREKR